MMETSPLSEATLREVLQKQKNRPEGERSKVCASLMRQMIQAGRTRREARHLLRQVTRQVFSFQNSRG